MTLVVISGRPPRWLLWLPVGALCLLSGVLGLRMGGEASGPAAVERIAAHYVRDVEGARPGDCVAAPGQGHASILVACGAPDSEARRIYPLDRIGRLVPLPET